jgi:dihydrofolate reductase
VSGEFNAGRAPARKIEIILLAAVAENGVIGRDNALPWRLKSDLQRFRQISMGKPVLMGRKTYESIGKPLKGRSNIVVSRQRAFTAAGVVVAANIAAALESARGDALRRGADAIVVIGGTEIFLQTMLLADRLEITIVHAEPAGDTFFPAIDPHAWREMVRSPHPPGPYDDVAFTYVTYERAGG